MMHGQQNINKYWFICTHHLLTLIIQWCVLREEKRRFLSSVGIATRCKLDGPEIESRRGQDFSAPVQTGPGAHPASYTMGNKSFPGVKWGEGWR
jgi:hypothetical protein